MRLPSGIMSAPSPSPTHPGASAPTQGQTQPRTWEEEPKPLLCSQYETLSDSEWTHTSRRVQQDWTFAALWTETCYCKQGCSWTHTYSCPYWHTPMGTCIHLRSCPLIPTHTYSYIQRDTCCNRPLAHALEPLVNGRRRVCWCVCVFVNAHTCVPSLQDYSLEKSLFSFYVYVYTHTLLFV